jgi:mannose-6-phosphate isomerase-like protein (cupin superfamily)
LEESVSFADLFALIAEGEPGGPLWGFDGEDLNANLLLFDGGAGVAEHVNAEREVLIVALSGEGRIVIDGNERELRAGQAVAVPKGARRSIRSAGGRFAYLTCHRRRGGLTIQPRRDQTQKP